MAIRPVHALAAAGIVIAAAAVSAVVTRAPAPVPPGSSPIPTEAQAVSPTPAATTPAPGSERYGLILGASRRVAGFPAAGVRSEADPRKLGDLATELFNGAVSPDGRRVAYWETPRVGAARVLRLLDGSAPAQPRILLTLPDTEAASGSTAGGVAWSSDGTGLLVAVNGRDDVSRPAPEGPPVHAVAYAALRQVDLASGSVREIVRREPGLPLRPVAWDRARGMAAAVEIGPGGYATSYILVRDGAAPIRTALDLMEILALSVRAAPDASRVFVVSWRPAHAVHVWPLAEPERRATMDLAAGERVATAMWRNAREIVVSLEGDVPGADRLEVWPLEGPRRVLLRGRHELNAVRPDGSAAIVSGQAVDLVTGATWPIPWLTKRVDASFLLR